MADEVRQELEALQHQLSLHPVGGWRLRLRPRAGGALCTPLRVSIATTYRSELSWLNPVLPTCPSLVRSTSGPRSG